MELRLGLRSRNDDDEEGLSFPLVKLRLHSSLLLSATDSMVCCSNLEKKDGPSNGDEQNVCKYSG